MELLRRASQAMCLGLIPLVLCGCALSGGSSRSGQIHAGGQSGARPAIARDAFSHGIAILRAGDAQSAEQTFASIVRQYPRWAAAYANLGTARMKQGKTQPAVSAYKKAVKLAPNLDQAWLRLGVLYRRAGDYPLAEKAYKAAVKARPENRLAHLDLGILYDVYMHQPDKALQQYQKVQKLSATPDKKVALWMMQLKSKQSH